MLAEEILKELAFRSQLPPTFVVDGKCHSDKCLTHVAVLTQITLRLRSLNCLISRGRVWSLSSCALKTKPVGYVVGPSFICAPGGIHQRWHKEGKAHYSEAAPPAVPHFFLTVCTLMIHEAFGALRGHVGLQGGNIGFFYVCVCEHRTLRIIQQ